MSLRPPSAVAPTQHSSDRLSQVLKCGAVPTAMKRGREDKFTLDVSRDGIYEITVEINHADNPGLKSAATTVVNHVPPPDVLGFLKYDFFEWFDDPETARISFKMTESETDQKIVQTIQRLGEFYKKRVEQFIPDYDLKIEKHGYLPVADRAPLGYWVKYKAYTLTLSYKR